MGKLNHHVIDNGDITSDVPVDSSYDSVPYRDTPPIKSIDDDEMYHLLEFFHSEHDDDLQLDWWSPLLQNCIQYILCYFIKTEEQMFQSQIACHTFLCFSQPRPLQNLLMKTRDMPKELGLFYVAFKTVRLYIQLDQFIIVQVTLPTLYHQVPSSFILVSRK